MNPCIRLFLGIFAACCLFSCANPSLTNEYDIFGPEEFVSASQDIAEGGKSFIKQMQGESLVSFSENDLYEYVDVIAEDDRLNIVVYHPKRIDVIHAVHIMNIRLQGFQVTDGCVLLPFISSIQVAGLTLEQARDTIRQRFREELPDIDVFVTFIKRNLSKVEITGLTGISTFPIDGKTRLFEVLAIAHLPPQANLYTSYVLRNGCQLDVDLYKLVHQGDMSQNIVLCPGDKIYIGSPEDKVVMMMGDVIYQRPVPVPHGFISLKQALALAGGIPYFGDRCLFHVIRGGVISPQIFSLSWDFVIHQTNENLLLLPGDVVYISKKPITEWNIFLSQLVPTYNALQAGQAIRSNFK